MKDVVFAPCCECDAIGKALGFCYGGTFEGYFGGVDCKDALDPKAGGGRTMWTRLLLSLNCAVPDSPIYGYQLISHAALASSL